MKRTVIPVLAVLAVSATMIGSALAHEMKDADARTTPAVTATQTAAATTAAPSQNVQSQSKSVNTVNDVQVLDPAAIPDGWWKDDN